MASYELENPFYHNYVFSEFDLNRAKIKWWQYPLLWFSVSYVQLADCHIFHYKRFNGRIYLMKIIEMHESNQATPTANSAAGDRQPLDFRRHEMRITNEQQDIIDNFESHWGFDFMYKDEIKDAKTFVDTFNRNIQWMEDHNTEASYFINEYSGKHIDET